MKHKLSMSRGQYLYLISANSTMPETVGDKKYEPVDRLIINDMIRALYRELRVVSPASEHMPGKDSLLLFGPEDAWKKEDAGVSMVDPEREIEVELSKDAVDGLVWCMYILLFPRTNQKGEVSELSPKESEKYVWPLLEQFGKANVLRENIGLNKIDKKHRWGD